MTAIIPAFGIWMPAALLLEVAFPVAELVAVPVCDPVEVAVGVSKLALPPTLFPAASLYG